MEVLLHWVSQYGYAALFALLVLGIVGLPVPDETLLTFAGYLAYRNDLRLPLTLLVGILGSLCGITASYLIGRSLGFYLVHKYGPKISLSQERLDRVHAWFERTGKWSLVVGYFIPGVRHLTAYIAGATKLEWHMFAIYAYAGGILWATLFILLGYFVGEQWETVSGQIESKALLAVGLGLLLLLLALIFRKMKSRMNL